MHDLLIAFAACVAVYGLVILGLLLAGRASSAGELVRFVPDCARLMTRLARDPATSRKSRVLLTLAGAYLIFPIDIVPDFIPVAGQLDDVVLIVFVLRLVLRSADQAALKRMWSGSPTGLRAVLKAAGQDPERTDY